ncbi:MAG: hypothetical protein ABJB47_01700 [Actinomycetota bacterium]
MASCQQDLPGTGPLLLPVAAGLAQAGVRVVAVLEATPAHADLPQAAGLAAFPGQLREATDYAAVLARHRVPLRTGCAVVACQGTDRVERAVIARLDRDWRLLPGSRHEETVDAVHVSAVSAASRDALNRPLRLYWTATSANCPTVATIKATLFIVVVSD